MAQTIQEPNADRRALAKQVEEKDGRHAGLAQVLHDYLAVRWESCYAQADEPLWEMANDLARVVDSLAEGIEAGVLYDKVSAVE